MADNERPLAEQLARQILAGDPGLEWLRPLAREFLKTVEKPKDEEPPANG